VLIFWILGATVIFVIVAIVVDVGLWLTERRKAQMARRNGFDDDDPDIEVTVDPDYGPGEVEVTVKQGSPMLFTGIFDIGSFDIGARGVSGLGSGDAAPLDLVLIVDRTSTMRDDLDSVQKAARRALEILDPNIQHVALGVIAASEVYPALPCTNPDPSVEWIPVKLREGNDYRNPDGSLNGSSKLVRSIDCLAVSEGPGTNLAHPVDAAVDELRHGSSQPSAKKAIVLLTDGQANQPPGTPCLNARQAADSARSAGIEEIFTIGFGVAGMACSDDSNPSPYRNAPVTELLADMATDSNDQFDCSSQSGQADENVDGDRFFCEAKGDDLVPVFLQIAEDLTQGYRVKE
jgi:hypothetical protein